MGTGFYADISEFYDSMIGADAYLGELRAQIRGCPFQRVSDSVRAD